MHTDCLASMLPIQDALEVISGKWKLLILTSVSAGNNRFRNIQDSIPKLSSKVLAKELKELETHQLIKHTVSEQSSGIMEYVLLPYAETLSEVLRALRKWGKSHRNKIMGQLAA